MSLVADYSDSSDSSDEETASQTSEGESPKSPPPSVGEAPPPPKLPSASQVLGQKGSKGDVFSNPFLEAELHKKASLEQHVKMVSNDDHLQQKNGRRICWNFRRGRCRFGTSCQFAHDSDLSVDGLADPPETPTPVAATAGEVAEAKKSKKRKHPGLGDHLEPGKRVLKGYRQQQQALQR